MPEANFIADAINEAQRLTALSKKEKELDGIYATNSDLSKLVKSLRRLPKKPEKQNLSGLTRQVADMSRQNSKLYMLIKKVVNAYGN